MYPFLFFFFIPNPTYVVPRSLVGSVMCIRVRPSTIRDFEVDLANTLAREIGGRAEFVPNHWSALVPSLRRQTFDLVLNGL